MKIHEYQAKTLLTKYGIPVPKGNVAFSVEGAAQVSREIGPPPYIIKAQIHAGGRGKGGGVKKAQGINEVEKVSKAILGMTLLTHQTGPEGKKVRKVLVEEGLEIDKEFYISIIIDRAKACPVIMVSPAGGMDIEEVAEKTPHLIKREWIDPEVGFQPFQGRNLIYSLPLSAPMIKPGLTILNQSYKLFENYDCSLLEINPLVATKDGRLVALDAKITFDDNALFRHKELHELLDPDEQDPLELEANRHNLNYIRLNGNIGVMVNGAGLAMATMDIIKLYGGEPANFLDVGGGANAETIARGFQIILSDDRVQAILINTFGGILRCDVLAEGLIEAAHKVNIKVPLIIRLEGTNVEKGREMLSQSGLDFLVAQTMGEAAQKISQLVMKT
ncbi:MAG: succinate--CoA ligase subunit beta [Deltaproteobacteria bacterium RBG_13_43_22]|nr:MAG: succinate--CoA ligase subunit beta [Deltaproteobacteria bacterium RBG_13_43_22]